MRIVAVGGVVLPPPPSEFTFCRSSNATDVATRLRFGIEECPDSMENEMFIIRNYAAAICVASLLFVGFSSTANAGLFGKKHCQPDCCEPCCEPAPTCCAPAPVCCEPVVPPKVNTTLCLVDQCTGCTKSVNVCIPACCVSEVPCITCRRGLFGRKIYSVSWKCCGHCVKVVWTKHGKIRVR